MSRIPIVEPRRARGLRRVLYWVLRRQYGGFVPGIIQVMMYDLTFGRAGGKLYNYLHLRRRSPMTRLQREMLATVVNGKVGGAP